MINILILSDAFETAGAYWRTTNPFAHLRKHSKNVSIQWLPKDKVTWAHLAMNDCIVMHRPYSELDYALYSDAKDLGCKLWLDYDDDITDIPIDNKTYDTYMDEKNVMRVGSMVALADMVTVSTQPLFEKYVQANKKTRILMNAIDMDHFKWRKVDKKSKEIRVLWRGSEHHQADLYEEFKAIIDVMNKHKDVRFCFVGYLPWQIKKETENYLEFGSVHVNRYHKLLHSLRPDILMVPLSNNKFNECKSNIAWIEGTMAGAVSLHRHWDKVWPVDPMFCRTYDDKKTFFGPQLDQLIQDAKSERESLSFMNNMSWGIVQRDFNLDIVNQYRRNIIKELTGQEVELLQKPRDLSTLP